MHVLRHKAIVLELTTDNSAIRLLHEHGESREVSPTADEIAILPFPRIDTLESGDVGGSIYKELLTLGVVVGERSRNGKHRPCGRIGREGDWVGVILARHYGDKSTLQYSVAVLCGVVFVLGDIIRNLVDSALHHILHLNHAAIDRLKSGTCDISVMVVGVGSRVLRTVHITPKTAKNIILYKLARFAVVKVENKLAGVVFVVGGYDRFYSTLTSGIPTSARKHLDGVVFEIGDSKGVGEFQLAGNDRSVGHKAHTLTRTNAHLNILLVVTYGNIPFQIRLTINDDGIVEGNHTRDNIIMHLRYPLGVGVCRSDNSILGGDGSIFVGHRIERTAIEDKLLDARPSGSEFFDCSL